MAKSKKTKSNSRGQKKRPVTAPSKLKQLSNSFSAGGGGSRFESRVQSAFVVLMLTGGFAPCLPPWQLSEIKLQGKYAGYDVDDFIATAEQRPGGPKAKLLAQIKHSLTVSTSDATFADVINASWADFKKPALFDPTTDAIAVITGPLSALDTEAVRAVLDLARHCGSSKDFFTKVRQGYFTSNAKRRKLNAFRTQLKRANGNVALTDEEFWQFLKCFHLLGYDLDLRSGVTLSLLKSHIGQFSTANVDALWDAVTREVVDANPHAGILTRDTLPSSLRDAFKERVRHEQLPAPPPAPPALAHTAAPLPNQHAEALKVLVLAGGFNEKSPADIAAIGKLINE